MQLHAAAIATRYYHLHAQPLSSASGKYLHSCTFIYSQQYKSVLRVTNKAVAHNWQEQCMSPLQKRQTASACVQQPDRWHCRGAFYALANSDLAVGHAMSDETVYEPAQNFVGMPAGGTSGGPGALSGSQVHTSPAP